MNKTNMITLAASLNLKDFNVMMVADGSGMTLDQPCGWACYSWDKGRDQFWPHLGGTSGGTNNYAELAPFLHGLWHWHQTYYANAFPRPKGIKVELVSDSEMTVKCGNGQYGRNTNLPLWAGIDWFVQNGYLLHWNHVPRNSNPLNAEADRRSRDVRLNLTAYITKESRPNA